MLCSLGIFFSIGVFAGNNKEEDNIVRQCNEVKKNLSEGVGDMNYNKELSEAAEDMDIYTDEHNTIYCMENCKIISFMKTDSSLGDGVSLCDIEEEKDEDEIRKIADACIEDVFNGDDYQFKEMQYHDDTETYNALYYKYIGEYPTSDMVYVFVKKNGEIKAAGNVNRGLFDDISIETADRSAIENYVKNVMTEKHGKTVEYSIDSIMLDNESGVTRYVINVFYNLNENVVDSDIIYMDAD